MLVIVDASELSKLRNNDGERAGELCKQRLLVIVDASELSKLRNNDGERAGELCKQRCSNCGGSKTLPLSDSDGNGSKMAERQRRCEPVAVRQRRSNYN